MHIVFNHGKESGPSGSKINALRAIAEKAGHSTASMDYQDLPHDPDARVERLLEYLSEQQDPLMLVGSSMGSYVATVAAMRRPVAALFLLAPAFYLPGFAVHDYKPKADHITVVHGWRDEIIPPENAIRFAKREKADLHIVDSDHRLKSALPHIEHLFREQVGRTS
jgi:alpha/beta superfamily hydrolase